MRRPPTILFRQIRLLECRPHLLRRLGEELAHWRAFYERTPTLPDALTWAIPAGVPEQRVFWESVANDPAGWNERVRRAVIQIFDERVADLHRQPTG